MHSSNSTDGLAYIISYFDAQAKIVSPEAMQLKVLYDFAAQPGSSELTIYQGEILTLLNKEIGAGWWEGVNSQGEKGLFPADYVEEYKPDHRGPQIQAATNSFDSSITPLAPISTTSSSSLTPPIQQQSGTVPTTTTTTTTTINILNMDSSMSSGFLATNQGIQFKMPEPNVSEEPDWPDEDWDDEDDSGDNVTEYSGPTASRGFPAGAPYYGVTSSQDQQRMSGGPTGELVGPTANLSLADTQRGLGGHLTGYASGPATSKAKKNFSQLSSFAKSNIEFYIRGNDMVNVPLENRVHIQLDQELGIVWKAQMSQYTCSVAKHGKETKMKGLKTFISYDITPSTSNICVRRRYKHFDWLLQRLQEKFIITPIPPLPEKQIAGRFQEDFVEHRRNLLQLWVNYITRHPVLSQCDVWWHFMTCSTDDMKGWKLGKRKAEKDELVGANFFHSVEVNPISTPLDSVKTTKQLENFERFVAKFDESVKHLFITSVDQSKKFSSIYSKDYKKLAESIKELASAFQSGTAWRNSLGLNEAIRQTSSAYDDVSRLFVEEPKNDFEPMADILHQYRGLLSSWPEILQLHKNAINVRNEQERLFEEGKSNESAVAKANQRVNTVTYATLAEINHFHNERLIDFKRMMQVFLKAQINFHSEILGRLHLALSKINDA